MTENKDAYYGILYNSSLDNLTRCEDLVGKHFYCFHGEGDKVVVSCNDGSYIISNNDHTQLFWQESLLKVSAGKSFLVGVSPNNTLYSWGVEGDNGQLGHSASVKKVFEPLQIQYKAEFKDISCGEAFSVALDSKGFAYAWGENFDRQLGIYSKSKDKMSISSAMIEEVVFSPKLIPLSMKQPMKQVCCGDRFVVALTLVSSFLSSVSFLKFIINFASFLSKENCFRGELVKADS
jgi:alpha-tubulin suppressor-like RCC1 family protein